EHHSKHLYLVGDPKQSIYGFRQADIYTYLAAGDFLGEERRVSLSTNYRSTQPLIEALNLLFSEETAPGLIALPRLNQVLPYQPVQSGNQEVAKPFTDHRGALHFFAFADLHGQKLNEAEEAYFFPFIADELSQLQAQGVMLSTCAVLIADRFQAVRLGNYLQNKGFPIVAQHSEKLTETIAFATVQEVLKAMLFPQSESRLKTALASPMFAWSESDILALEDPALLEQSMSQALALRKIWIDKGFSPFFHALLASVWNASGKSVIENLLSRENGLEFVHSIQQVGELLVEKETTENLPPRQLLKTLEELQRLEEEGEQAIKKRMNPEHEGVRILTIHSSKGLEFDIVFALGVINRSRKPSVFVPTIKNQESPLLTVVQSDEDENYIEYTRELDAEKIRQLYVAFTRAKRRLYVPLCFDSSRKEIDPGTASPMELYLGLWAHRDQDKILEMISRWTQNYAISMSIFGEEESGIGSFSSPSRPFIQLSLPPKANVVGKSLYMHSFTSLATKHEVQEEKEAENFFPNEDVSSVHSAHTLPAGSQIGVLLHQILEEIPFRMGYEEVDGESWNTWIRKFVEQTQFAPWGDVIAKMVHQALSIPLPLGDSHLALRDLQESHCYREHTFMYATDEALHSEFERRPGYLKGVIDLIFEHQGKFYFLDWKSNRLGPSSDWYTEEHLDEAMQQHDYYLQAKIYQEALKRYLKCVDSRPFEEIFGGGLYVFLRGLEASQGIKRLESFR
ncbi:MAG: 3'-5' exonuclease, partial [Parachlamydiaceae bacterium]